MVGGAVMLINNFNVVCADMEVINTRCVSRDSHLWIWLLWSSGFKWQTWFFMVS